MIYIKCHICGEEVERKGNSQKYCSKCFKKAHKGKVKEWALRNEEKEKQHKRKHYKENREKIINRYKEFRIKNKEYLKNYHKEYNIKNKERIINYKKEYVNINREKIKKYVSERGKENVVIINKTRYYLPNAQEEIKPILKNIIEQRKVKKILKEAINEVG